MARASQQSAGAITVWMIIFAALWLTSTVFLIVLYTGQEDLVTKNENLERAARRLASASEQRSIDLIRPMDENHTAVGILEDARRETALLASGTETDDPNAIRAKRDKLYEDITREGLLSGRDKLGDVSLLDGMTALYAAFQAEHGQLAAANERIESLDGEIRALQKEKTEQQADFEARAQDLAQQLAKAEADNATYRQERDAAVAGLEAEFEKRRAQDDEDLKNERIRSAQLERDLSELQQRFSAQEQKFGALMIGPEALATARQPDGKVLTAVPGDGVVYINLGAKDRLTLGLQFAVYASDEGVPADGRAKAQIEVVSMSDSSAECKIVRVAPNELIMEGDLVANPIYDPSRPQVFLVVGNFDLDRDGLSDPGGPAVVEALITEWGGKVTSNLDAMTDFVVVGSPPRHPRDTAPRDLSPEQARRLEADRATWQRYQDTVASAKSLSVPMLPQDVFLNFLGYRGRYTQR